MAKPAVYYEGRRTDVIPFLPKQYTKVLEIGCGEGRFRKNLHEECEYWGVEPVKPIAEKAQTVLDKVLIGTYDEVIDDIPDDYFDLVICNDVIEHMVDHTFFYRTISKKVKPSAYMVGAIPNVRFLPNLYNLLRKKDWEYTEEGILDKTHLRFFTKKSIERDFKTYNFTIEEFNGINRIKYRWDSKSNILMNIFRLLMGDDTEFLQFGFRVKINKLDT